MSITTTETHLGKEGPLVSVIIPTHNRPRLLQEALASVFAQEGTGVDFQMEVLVVYDVPEDVPEEIKAAHPEAQFLKQNGRGASAARNLGIKTARGKYIAFLDDDDLWLPHRLQTQVPVLEKRPEIGVIYGQAIVSGDANLAAWPVSAPSGRVFEEFLGLMEDFIPTDTLLIRREAIEKAGYFDESIPSEEHYDLCLRLAFYVDFLFLAGPVAHGRFSLTEDSLWHRSVLNGEFERSLPYVIEKALAMLPEGDDSEALKRRARIEVVLTIAKELRARLGMARVRKYLLNGLQSQPWMISEPAIVENVRQATRDLAQSSNKPIVAVKQYWKELGDRTRSEWAKNRSQINALLADVLVEAAFGLANRAAFWQAGCAAGSAFFYDPAWMRWKFFFARLVRALTSRFRQKLIAVR